MTISITKRCFLFLSFVSFYTCSCEEPKIFLPKFDENGDTIWSPKIVGGTAAYLGQYPGQISIQNRQGSHFCGGTLIDPSHILTAAHCVTASNGAVNSPSNYILMGDSLTTRNAIQANPNNQTRSATHVFVHSQYNIVTLQNDIAVIRISPPFTPSSTFRPVQRVSFTPAVNFLCSVAGWGSTYFNGPGSSLLQHVDASIIDRGVCNRFDSYNGTIRDGMLCAGTMAGGKDSCQGDSGGGLICSDLVAGIVSFGNECARPRFPGVYTDVSRYNTWIDSALAWSNGSHSSIPTPTTGRPISGSPISTQLISFYTAISGLVFVLFLR